MEESDDETAIEYSIEIVGSSSSSQSLVSSIEADNLSHSPSASSLADEEQQQEEAAAAAEPISEQPEGINVGEGKQEELFEELVVNQTDDDGAVGETPEKDIATDDDDAIAQLNVDSATGEAFTLIEPITDETAEASEKRDNNIIEIQLGSADDDVVVDDAAREPIPAANIERHETCLSLEPAADSGIQASAESGGDEKELAAIPDDSCSIETIAQQQVESRIPDSVAAEQDCKSSDAAREAEQNEVDEAADLNAEQSRQTLLIQLEAPSISDMNNENENLPPNLAKSDTSPMDGSRKPEPETPEEAPEPPINIVSDACCLVHHRESPDAVPSDQSCDAADALQQQQQQHEVQGGLMEAEQIDRSESSDVFEDTLESPIEMVGEEQTAELPGTECGVSEKAGLLVHANDCLAAGGSEEVLEDLSAVQCEPVDDTLLENCCRLDMQEQVPEQIDNLEHDHHKQVPQISIPPHGEDSEDLEREFDLEPVFERRQVEVKHRVNPRSVYSLYDELGRGKFGTVYRCVELASGKSFAAKFVLMRRREDRDDVNREIEIMSELQHKRLLQLFDAFDDGKSEMCLITELVDGGELFERIVNSDFELTEKKAAIFMRQICEGVEYMQSLNIVHLDMKPENILCVSRTGNRIKLIDFGLARKLRDDEPLRVMFGTPDFAAPEVLAYDQVSLATDMWSVGVICYVLLSGLSPFMGDSDMDTMANVSRATYDFDDDAFEPISGLAKDFIAKLLVKCPGERLKPAECLQHPWLRRGGLELEASIRNRRSSSIMLSADDLVSLQQKAGHDIVLPSAPPLELDDSAAGCRSPTSPPTLSTRNLKKYVVRRKWHRTVHAIMALQRMGAHLKFD